jgi:hypothetical protein
VPAQRQPSAKAVDEAVLPPKPSPPPPQQQQPQPQPALNKTSTEQPQPTSTSAGATAPDSATAPSSGAVDYRARVEAFYRMHNPDKLDTLDRIMETFKGREAVLLDKLEKKYAAEQDMI